MAEAVRAAGGEAVRPWRSLDDLAALMEDRARRNQMVELTPTTATLVASKLRGADARPQEREIARIICGREPTCASTCFSCQGKVNQITRLYGMKFPGRASAPALPAADTSAAMKMGDLRAWNLLTCRCREKACGYETTVRAIEVAKRLDPAMLFRDYEAQVRCSKCKSADVALIVTKMPR